MIKEELPIYSEEEVYKSTLEYYQGEELPARVWMNKYCLKDTEGQYRELNPLDRFKSIEKELVRIDKKYGDSTSPNYAKLMEEGFFLPGGSGIYGIANPFSFSSIGNCFVISTDGEDSYGSVFRVDQEMGQIMKRRGGVGCDISPLRPKSFKVSNAAGSSTGSTSFTHRFSNTTREVAQDGRRGALMLSQSIRHPDIKDFITIKSDEVSVTGANMSVRVDDGFMDAVENGENYTQQWPVTGKAQVSNEVDANGIFDTLVDMNWKRAEPGILFWDNIIKESPADLYKEFPTSSTNPCGELPLSPYDSCRLLAVNLTACVLNPFTDKAKFDWDTFKRVAKVAMRAMDNIIDLEIEKINSIIQKIKNDPESDNTKAIELNIWENILRATETGRRSGLSIIGHGDALAMLGIKYGSTAGNAILDVMHEIFAKTTYTMSQTLAETRGAFPAFGEVDESGHPFLERVQSANIPRRNIAILTIPPAGTQSLVILSHMKMLGNQSSGIEPVFATHYERNVKVDGSGEYDFIDKTGDKFKTHLVLHSGLKMFYNIALKGDFGQDIESLSKDQIDRVVELSPYNGATSHFIDPIEKVKLQGRIQKWIDHSVSVTHNLPKEATRDDVKNIYMTAWKAGCKGCTVYRDGSRSGILNTTSEEKETKEAVSNKRPREVVADVHTPKIKGTVYNVLVGMVNGKPFEIFAYEQGDVKLPTVVKIIKKKGMYQVISIEGEVLVERLTEQFKHEEFSTITRLASLLMKVAPLVDTIKQLNRSTGIITEYGKILARVLRKYEELEEVVSDEVCPSCGEGIMIYQGGCNSCNNCGHSTKCS